MRNLILTLALVASNAFASDASTWVQLNNYTPDGRALILLDCTLLSKVQPPGDFFGGYDCQESYFIPSADSNVISAAVTMVTLIGKPSAEFVHDRPCSFLGVDGIEGSEVQVWQFYCPDLDVVFYNDFE